MYDVRLDRESGDLRMSEVSAFITPAALVTVRKDDQFDMDAVVAQWDRSSDLAHCGVSFLLYGLIDHVYTSSANAPEASARKGKGESSK